MRNLFTFRRCSPELTHLTPNLWGRHYSHSCTSRGRVEEAGRQAGYSMEQMRGTGPGVASAVLTGTVQEGQRALPAVSLLAGNTTADACSGNSSKVGGSGAPSPMPTGSAPGKNRKVTAPN